MTMVLSPCGPRVPTRGAAILGSLSARGSLASRGPVARLGGWQRTGPRAAPMDEDQSDSERRVACGGGHMGTIAACRRAAAACALSCALTAEALAAEVKPAGVGIAAQVPSVATHVAVPSGGAQGGVPRLGAPGAGAGRASK